MNGLHDPHVHKRTSITELLNPIAAAPAIDYHPNQLPGFDSFAPASHAHHLSSASSPYPQPPMHSSSSFSLRAASWDHASKDDMSMSHSDSDTPARRYAPPPMPAHSMYPDSYPRHARPVTEAPNYGMPEAPPWPSSASDPTYPPPPPPLLSPGYSEERTAVSGDSFHKGYPSQHQQHQPQQHHSQQHQQHQQHQQQQQQQYEQDMAAQHYMHARGSMPPQMQAPPSRGQMSPPAYYAQPLFAAFPYMTQPAVQKRPLDAAEEEPVQKAKKRTKAKPVEGSPAAAVSRRGYNAKKRSEAAQIAAQNAQLMPTVSYAHVLNEKGKEKASDSGPMSTMRIVTEDGQVHPETSGPLHPELQFARCMSNRYRSEEFPRCVSCTRRWAGDTCRFQGIRFFLKNDTKNIVGISFVESQKPDSPTMNFPVKWNIPLEAFHIGQLKRTVAIALLPTLKAELEHLKRPEVIRRPRESEVRATCDTCMTSIFSCSWMCRLCGREACAECYEQVKELTVDRVGAPEAEIAALQARREKHAHVNPFFLSCTRRNEHQAKDFSPMSRFCKNELAQAIEEMDALIAAESDKMAPAVSDPPANGSSTSGPSGSASTSPLNHGVQSDTAGSSVSPNGTPTEPTPPSSGSDSSSVGTAESPTGMDGLPSHKTLYFKDTDLTDEVFRSVWAKGEPIVVTELLQKFHIKWTPEYFCAKYGTQSCLILECQTDQNRRVTVGEFFSWFGKYEGRRDCWKLKDWPPSTDFRTAFPELFDDFSLATPVPNYVRRDGVLNLASHFPNNTVAPDLGPKMYNAMASFESQGSKGSTRLHMDMADAINIMLFAAPTFDGRPGCAAWDLFKAEDSMKLRKFLRKKFKGQFQHDPIHSQQFYLDAALREELYHDYGVKSHRIYQKPGEAVFIPAGCAHQVCNLADCIKVASDFVSPENIERCEMLTREFREQNQSMAWKEDVLQLRTMMWFAWLSCRRQEKELDN